MVSIAEKLIPIAVVIITAIGFAVLFGEIKTNCGENNCHNRFGVKNSITDFLPY